MVNRSQIQDPRFYAKWKAAGALGDIHEPERREAKRHYKNMLIYNGGLSKAEVKEAVSYKFGDGAVTLTEQTRKYYLMVKENHPKEA